MILFGSFPLFSSQLSSYPFQWFLKYISRYQFSFKLTSGFSFAQVHSEHVSVPKRRGRSSARRRGLGSRHFRRHELTMTLATLTNQRSKFGDPLILLDRFLTLVKTIFLRCLLPFLIAGLNVRIYNGKSNGKWALVWRTFFQLFLSKFVILLFYLSKMV